MNILAAVCFVTLALIIWFKTNAFVEYTHLFKIGKWFKVDTYIEMETDQTFPDFLKEYYNCFLTRLMSCPICTSVWLGLFAAALTSLAAYPIITVFGLFLYLTISKLL